MIQKSSRIATRVLGNSNAFSRNVLGNHRLAALVRVPLFLQELLHEASEDRALSTFRFDILSRMVDRATNEHRQVLSGAHLLGVESRYLANLAWRMVEQGATTISSEEARASIAHVSIELRLEAFFSAEPSPPRVLECLINSHLLISEENSAQLSFTHQLVQEYFTAIQLARYLGDDRAADSITKALESWQWSIPIQLCIEKLSSQGDYPNATRLLVGLAAVDFDAACRCLGDNQAVWESAKDAITDAIRQLSSSTNVNANWLAARSAAATGQSVFSGVVFAGLAGYPPGSHSWLPDVPIANVVRSLGDNWTQQILAIEKSELRLRILNELGASAAEESRELIGAIAIHDSSPANRILAFKMLFERNESGWLRPFLREVRAMGGWSSGLLIVVGLSRQCSIIGWRRRMTKLLRVSSDLAAHYKALRAWVEYDREGAARQACIEYDWLEHQPFDTPEASFSYQKFCLCVAAKVNEAWTREKLLLLVNIGNLASLPELPTNVLTTADRKSIVEQFMPDVIRSDSGVRQKAEALSMLEPDVAATVILGKLCEEGAQHRDRTETWTIKNALTFIPRDSLIRVACQEQYRGLQGESLLALIDALAYRRDRLALRQLDADLQHDYRERLLAWQQYLPPISYETNPIWCSFASLLGEMGDSRDAAFVISLLRKDSELVKQQQSRWRDAVRAFETSGRTTARPQPLSATSYSPLYQGALFGFSGNAVAEQVTELLRTKEEVAFAANWLATNIDAPRSSSASFQRNFSVIGQLRSREPAFIAQAEPLNQLIRNAIDQALTASGWKDVSQFSRAFEAVARLDNEGAGEWVTERVEQYFADEWMDGLFENLILLGCKLQGSRILPFAHRVIAGVSGSRTSSNDQTYRVESVLCTLFYSDTPQAAIDLLAGDAAWFMRSHHFKTLLVNIVWIDSELIDEWATRLSLDESLPIDARVMLAAMLLHRARRTNNIDMVSDSAKWFAKTADAGESEHSRMVEDLLASMMSENRAVETALLANAENSSSAQEALRWLRVFSSFGSVRATPVALKLAERFGEEHVPAVTALAPIEQVGGSLTFSGWAYFQRRRFHFEPEVMTRLYEILESPQPALSRAARRAVLWIERERIQGNSPTAGFRGLHWNNLAPSWPIRVLSSSAW